MIKIYFDNTLIDENYYSELTNDYKLFTDNFYLGSTASNTFKLSVAKTAVSSHPTEVKITDDTNTYYLIVDKIYEEKNFYVYDLVDKLVLFNFNYNAKTLIDTRAAEELTTTLSDILADMCTQAGITLDSTLTLINDIEVTWYDNIILARDYLSYIAELQGGFARILDDGKLTIVGQKMASQATIQIDNCEDFILGEKKTISRVVYDNGIVKYEYGDETANTLYINQNNVYITDTTVVSNIYDEVVGLEFYLVETGKCQLDPSVRAGDIITFTDGVDSYLTIAQYNGSYGGGYWLGNYSLNVASKQQEETQVIGLNTELKSIKTIIDRANASLKIVAEEIETLTPSVEKSVKSTKVQYYLSTSNVSPTGSSWSDTAPEWEEDKFMFTRTTTTLNDNTLVYSPSANGTLLEGLKGKDGESGTSSYTYIRYSKNADGTGFTSAPQVDTEYIGIAVTSSAIAPTLKGDYTWSKYVGQDGTSGEDGASIWSTTVAPVTPNYTFTKTNLTGPVGVEIKSGDIILYSYYRYTITTISSTTVLAPTRVSIRGATGATGADGIQGPPGADGQSQYTYIRYSKNSNGNPMTTTPDSETKYIGLAVTTSATAPTGYASYTWSKFVGDDGEDGQQGIPGTPGANGITYYTWIKYADTPTTGMSDNPSGKPYIGIAHNKTTASESTTYGDYTWSLIKGDTGTGIVSITAQYYKSTSSSTQTGGSWSSTPPTYEKNKYLWFRNEIVYKNPTSTEYTTPQLDTTWEEIGAVETRTASLEVRTGDIEGNVEDLIDLTDFVKTASGTTTNFQIPNTPKSNGAINTLSIKKIPFMALYPGMAYPSETTYPGALTFYTLVFDTTASFNNTPSYVYINSPIALRTLGSTYDEILIENNKVKIIQRVSLNGSLVLGTPITHNLGDVILPTFDGNTYVKLLYFTNLIWSTTYITKNDYSEVFATQLESSSQFLMNSKQVVLKVKADGEVAGLELGAGQEGEGSSFKVKAKNIGLEGYTTINNGFSVDLEGNATMNNATINGPTLKLADNTEIVGGNGILTNLQYKSVSVTPLGYRQINFEGIGLLYGFIELQGFIPDNFTIREAYITVSVYKTLNEFLLPETFGTTSEYGKVTNIRLYKVASTAEYINSTDFGLFGFDLPTGTEVTNAFATGGYTNPTTDGISFTSIDIADELDSGTNDFFIATGDTLPDGGTNAGTTTAAQKSQIAIATLTIIGWLN